MIYLKACPQCKKDTELRKLHRSLIEKHFKFRHYDKYMCESCSSVFMVNQLFPQRMKIIAKVA